jgi:hypothetical protein
MPSAQWWSSTTTTRELPEQPDLEFNGDELN